MSIYEVAMRMSPVRSSILLGLIAASLVLPPSVAVETTAGSWSRSAFTVTFRECVGKFVLCAAQRTTRNCVVSQHRTPSTAEISTEHDERARAQAAPLLLSPEEFHRRQSCLRPRRARRRHSDLHS
jgi:hypothetical protein